MGFRQFRRNAPEDIKLLESLVRDSGSKSCAKERAIMRRTIFYTKPENLWCEIYNEVAFYMCIRCKKHIRGVFTIVRKDYHGKGLGKLINDRRLQRMYYAGIDTFTFRTNRNEPAINFWLKQGARIVDIKGNDYEMELKIKL